MFAKYFWEKIHKSWDSLSILPNTTNVKLFKNTCWLKILWTFQRILTWKRYLREVKCKEVIHANVWWLTCLTVIGLWSDKILWNRRHVRRRNSSVNYINSTERKTDGIVVPVLPVYRSKNTIEVWPTMLDSSLEPLSIICRHWITFHWYLRSVF